MVPEIWSATDRTFLSFWTIFCPFTTPSPPNNLKNQNFEKMIKTPRDITILQMCSINYNYMMYEVWSATDRIFCHFGPFFALYPPPHPNNPESQNFEKMKKAPGDITILQMCSINHKYMMYEVWSATDRIFCHFGLFFALLPPPPLLTTQKIKILRK